MPRSTSPIATDVAAARRKALLHIRDVHGSGGLKDGWRDNLGGFVNKFVAPILPALNTLSAGLGIAALALAWVPFLGPALGAAALIVAGVAFLANLAMSVGKEAGWRDTIIAGVGLATFGLGKIASARYVTSAGGARGVGLATFGLGKIASARYVTSAGGARGAARRLAGQWAARSPAARRTAGLPANASSGASVSSMMGRAGPVSRNDARALLQGASANGTGAAAREFATELPGKTWQELKGIKNFRPLDARGQMKAHGATDRYALMGERP